MKAILISIRPQHVANILNLIKTLEIRKKFPSDYVGWVYIYCTHGRHLLDLRKEDTKDNYRLTNQSKSNNVRWSYPPIVNGKVVARFWCEKVEKIHCNSYGLETSEHWYRTQEMNGKELLEKSCLTFEELDKYLCWNNGYAIHITKLEIFDEPKWLIDFKTKVYPNKKDSLITKSLTRVPQSYCFIEV